MAMSLRLEKVLTDVIDLKGSLKDSRCNSLSFSRSFSPLPHYKKKQRKKSKAQQTPGTVTQSAAARAASWQHPHQPFSFATEGTLCLSHSRWAFATCSSDRRGSLQATVICSWWLGDAAMRRCGLRLCTGFEAGLRGSGASVLPLMAGEMLTVVVSFFEWLREPAMEEVSWQCEEAPGLWFSAALP